MIRGLFLIFTSLFFFGAAQAYNTNHYNACVNQHNCKNKDLSGAVFNNFEAGSVSFQGSNLRNATFDGAGLNSANFSNSSSQKTNLEGAKFKNCHMPNAIFKGVTNMQGMQIINSYAEHINFYNANLGGATLRGNRYTYGDFRKASMSNTLLKNINLTMAKFQNTDIRGSQFINIYASGINFSNAFIRRAAKDGIKDAKMEGVDFRNSVWNNAFIRYITFTNGSSKDCNLNHSNVPNSDWQGSDVLKCSDKNVDWNSTSVTPKNY